MGGKRVRTDLRIALTLTSVLCLPACSADDASTSGGPATIRAEPPASTTNPTTPSTSAAPTTLSSVESSTAEVPVLLPVDDASAVMTLEVLSSTGLGDWIDQARAAVAAPEPPCDPDSHMLTPEQFTTALSLADQLTGELISNLDASLGAAAEWCRRNDPDAARTELDDAAATAALLERRLGELDR